MEGFGGAAYIGFTRSPTPPSSRSAPSGPSASGSNERIVPTGPSAGRGGDDRGHAGSGPSRQPPSGPSASRGGDSGPAGPIGSGGGSGGRNGSGDGTGQKGKKRKMDDRDTDSKSSRRGPDYAGPRNLQQERAAAERSCPWATDVDWDACDNPAQMLNEEINAYYRFMSPTPAEFEVRLLTIESICRAIKESYPRADIRPFGSWQTQLYLPQGDIDLVVTVDSFPPGSSRITGFLRTMAQTMRRLNITDNVVVIAKAKVPIIKFVTIEGRIQVDISVNQTNGLQAGGIINGYLDQIPGARQLIMVVKAFLSQRSLNEVFTGGLGSYSVICLVISFLQIHPKVHRDQINPERNLGVLLMEFFELYGRNFHYDADGISLLHGGSYFRKQRKGFYRSDKPFLLSIEDPQSPGNDISVGSYGILKIRQAFAGAYDMLQVRLFERVQDITARRTGMSTGYWEPGEMSILNAIMGATSDMIRQRDWIQELHSSGRLHHKLGIRRGADLSLHVSNFRKPHVLASWSPRTGSGSTRSDAGPGPSSAHNGTASSSSRDRNHAGPSGLGAVMMDDHDTSRAAGVYSSDDEADADADAELKMQVANSRSRSGNGTAVPSESGSIHVTGESEFASSAQGDDDDDDDIMELSASEFDAQSAQRRVERNGSALTHRRANGNPGAHDSTAKRSRRERGKRMNERFESVSQDEDDYDEVNELDASSDDGSRSGAGLSFERRDTPAPGGPATYGDGEEDEEDSRYATSTRQEKKRRLNDAVQSQRDRGDEASGSDSDVELLEPPSFSRKSGPAIVYEASGRSTADAGGSSGDDRAAASSPARPLASIAFPPPTDPAAAPAPGESAAPSVSTTTPAASELWAAASDTQTASDIPTATAPTAAKVSRQDRRDFWAAKGPSATKGAAGDGADDFADGADYIAL